jgi:hypothetical protein
MAPYDGAGILDFWTPVLGKIAGGDLEALV